MDRIRGLLPNFADFTRRQWVASIILFVSYSIAAYIGTQLFTSPAVIVPASGIALAGLVLEGIELWPAIYLGALVVGVFTGSLFFSLLILPVAQALQAVVGAYVLKKLDFEPLMRRLRDMFLIMGVALTTSAIVPSLGFVARYLNIWTGHPSAAIVTWGSWWTGHMLSLLVVAPLIIRWCAEPYFYKNPQYQQKLRVFEITVVLAVLIAIDWLLVWRGVAQLDGVSLIYFMLVPLFWLAIRVGPRFTILGVFITAAMFIIGTFFGPLAPPAAQLGVRLFQLEVFINIIAIIFYIIAGLQEERTEAIKSLTSYIDKLEEALNRLSLQDRAKSDFIALLAHELRNPLAPIVSALELIKLNHPKTGEEGEALNLMDDRLKTIERLLDDLLDVSRITHSKLKLKKEPVDLRTIIEHSIQAIERHIKTRSQTLVMDIPSEAVILDADPVRVEQVVTNLLTNASKFTGDNGRISVSAKREGDMATIRVEDNGIGIDPAMLNRIFEAFLQLETGKRDGGLGIGLSLTQRLVEMHGGTIEAASEGPGRGSAFVVRLPVLPAYTHTPLAERRKSPGATLPSASGERILVVDDNVPAAHGIGKLLEYKGWEVAYAYTGTEAKQIIEHGGLYAVLLDIGLPDMDGYDLARMVRLGFGFKGILIALTGYGQEEDKERARESGFDYHLTKPVGIDELHTLLTTAKQ